MQRLTHPVWLAGAFVILIALWSSFFVVTQGEQALVLRFGAVAYPDHPVFDWPPSARNG